MFITTANLLDPIPGPLRDRMEIIELSSYTEDEKVQIAKQYLIPRQIKENGLLAAEAQFTEAAIREVIQGYTREAGVRNLERQLGKICRKIAAQVAAYDDYGKRTSGTGGPTVDADPAGVRNPIDRADLVRYLGKREIHAEEIIERVEIPGVAIGLAWTATGGDIMFFEATKSPGDKGFTLTGQLGDVMKESAQAALSFVRSRAQALDIDPEVFRKSDIHLHIPAGAIPKDGPSAGITMATALVSLLTGRPLRPKIGMTGEITLRGKVLPIGGVKEKVLAAARFGLETIILPKRNEADLDDLPTELREKLTFVLVDTVDEVWQMALE
jgi:ATP-dependent Lon protease